MAHSFVITALLGALQAGVAPDRSAPPPVVDTSLASLYAAREKVWRDFFRDPEGLAEALPPGFVAVETGDTVWADRATTLARSRASVRGGTRLVSLRFPHNRVERYGNVAVIHSRYEMVLEGASRDTFRGNVTEVFVWTGTRWSHPSWHLDYDPEQAPVDTAARP